MRIGPPDTKEQAIRAGSPAYLGLAALHTSGVTYGETITWADRVADVEEQRAYSSQLNATDGPRSPAV